MKTLFLLSLLTAAGGAEVPAFRPVSQPPPEPLPGYEQVVMMPLSSLGSAEQARRAVQQILVREVRKLLQQRLLAPKQLAERHPRIATLTASCRGDVGCLLEVVGARGLDGLMVGNVAGLGENRAINLKLYDVTEADVVRTTSEKASGEEKELIRRIRKAAVEILAPARYTGTLVLDAKQPQVQISLDGKLLGTTPLAESRYAVPVGQHAIEATGDGRVPFESMIEIAYGETKPITIRLPKNQLLVGGDTPYYARWWTWVLAGVGVVGLGLGSYFNVQQQQAAADIAGAADACVSGTSNCALQLGGDLYAREQQQRQLAQVFYGLGGGLLGGTGVLLSFDLF